MSFRINHGTLTSYLKGKSPVFWSWTFGNFGYRLSVIAAWAACPDFIKGTSTESRERCWTLCFPPQICAKWACTVLYFQINLLIEAPVPTFYDISYKVPATFTLILSHHILTLSGSKLRASFAHQVKNGPREVCSLPNLLSNFSFSCL